MALGIEAAVLEASVRELLKVYSGLGDEVIQILPESNLWELGMESKAAMNVLIAIEDRFDVEFPEDGQFIIESLSSINGIMTCVSSLAQK